MATIHIRESDGAAKCGCNVFKHYEYDKSGPEWKVIKIEKKVRFSQLIYFASDKNPANCRRCLNKITRPTTAAIAVNEDHSNTVFHRSFGYDMTINVYAKVIGYTEKGLRCQECFKNISGSPWDPRATGKAAAGDINQDKKPFIMLKKTSPYGYTYWTGDGETWSIWDGSSNYENRCD